MYTLFLDEGSKPEQPKEPEPAPAKETEKAEPQENKKVVALEILPKNPSFNTCLCKRPTWTTPIQPKTKHAQRLKYSNV